mmetsp:Transcript_36224/g.90145  ORF Transcript_36224/g.90145 Transcript_36224/m.90145 type:complete len:132 (-) Transcript_36224:1394-1789(-)
MESQPSPAAQERLQSHRSCSNHKGKKRTINVAYAARNQRAAQRQEEALTHDSASFPSVCSDFHVHTKAAHTFSKDAFLDFFFALRLMTQHYKPKNWLHAEGQRRQATPIGRFPENYEMLLLLLPQTKSGVA